MKSSPSSAAAPRASFIGRALTTERRANVVITITTTNGVSNSQLTSAGTLLSTTSTNYNDLAQVTSSTDAAGNTTTVYHDMDGHREIITDPLLNSTIHEYDLRGKLR